MNDGARYKVQSLLPHRAPFLFIDSWELASEEGDSAWGTKLFSLSEPYHVSTSQGGVVPLSILLECMAQLSAIIGAHQSDGQREQGSDTAESNEPGLGYLIAINYGKLEQAVKVGIPIRVFAKITHRFGKMMRSQCHIEQGGKRCAEATLSFQQL